MKKVWFRLAAVLSVVILLGTQQVAAFTSDDVGSLQTNTPFYDPNACAAGSTGSTAPTTPTGVTIDNAAAQKVAQAASTGGTNVGYALYDSTGKLLANYNDTFENYGASITKSMILVAYLNQVGSGTLSSSATANLTGMIEQSDDQDSNNVLGLLNDPASQISAVASSAGMTGFKPNLTGDSLYNLGQSQITANDFAKFFSKIDTMFPPAQKSFALGLLSTITPQAGLLQAGLPGTVYSKEGWKPEPGGGSPNPFGNEGSPWVVNQAGQFTSGGTTYGVAVTVGGTDSESSGESIVKNVVSALVNPGNPSTPSPTASSCSCTASGVGSGPTTLTGTDNEDKTWNYFKTQGLSDAQTAGIMGNLQQESGFVPNAIQGGGTTNDPSALDTGYGLAQWYGDKIEGEASAAGVSGNIYDLLTQLNLIWAQLKQGQEPYNASPTTLKTIESTTDAGQVATLFDNNFEGGTDPGGTGPPPTDAGPGGVRETNAASILTQYGGTGSTTTTSTGSCSQPGTSPDCTTATGDAKILCEAEQWKGIWYFYGGGHESLSAFQSACPDLSNPPDNQSSGKVGSDGYSGNPSPCAVDCSGLVDLSTDMAFGVDMGGVNVAGIETSPYWKKVDDMSTVQPGDIVTVDPNVHVEIVDHYDPSSGTLYTFGAHETGQQDGVVPSTLSSWTGAYRYMGPGSN
jgi:hypothetical protein